MFSMAWQPLPIMRHLGGRFYFALMHVLRIAHKQRKFFKNANELTFIFSLKTQNLIIHATLSLGSVKPAPVPEFWQISLLPFVKCVKPINMKKCRELCGVVQHGLLQSKVPPTHTCEAENDRASLEMDMPTFWNFPIYTLYHSKILLWLFGWVPLRKTAMTCKLQWGGERSLKSSILEEVTA